MFYFRTRTNVVPRNTVHNMNTCVYGQKFISFAQPASSLAVYFSLHGSNSGFKEIFGYVRCERGSVLVVVYFKDISLLQIYRKAYRI